MRPIKVSASGEGDVLILSDLLESSNVPGITSSVPLPSFLYYTIHSDNEHRN